MTGVPLDIIDRIVVERNGQVVYTEDNVVPGAEMMALDVSVPYFDAFNYAVYAITNGRRGASAVYKNVYVGPTCDWRILMQSNSVQGWKGGYVSLYCASGKEIGTMTLSNSTTQSLEFAVPVGNVSFGWTASHGYVSNISIVVKDAEDNTVYTYSGNSYAMPHGLFLETNNGCGYEKPETPYNVVTELGDDDVLLHWEINGNDPEYGFNIYRDERIYVMVNDPSARSFIDGDFSTGHCYVVTAIGFGGESEQSNEYCASTGDCMGASNMDYELVGDNYRIKLLWDRPENDEGLSGYYLFRKKGEEDAYTRIKLIGASSTSFIDNTAHDEGDYYYRLYAYYRAIDCTSAPATAKDEPGQFYLKVHYSPLSVNELKTVDVNLFPNPADHSLRVEAEGMTGMSIYNMLGQLVFDTVFEGNVMDVNVSEWEEGIYLLKIHTTEGVLSHRVSIVH